MNDNYRNTGGKPAVAANLDDLIDNTGKEQPFSEKTEIEAAMNSLDADKADKASFSNIDFNARVSSHQAVCMAIIDELVRSGLYPEELTITRNMKRISVSIGGEGRKEKVSLFQGQREHSEGAGAMGRFGRLFQRQP